LARIGGTSVPIEGVKARIFGSAPTEGSAARGNDGSAMPGASDDPVLIWSTFTDEGVNHVCAGSPSAFALDQLTATRKRSMGSRCRIELSLGVGAFVARRALDHGRQAGRRTLHPTVLARLFPPIVDALQTARAARFPHGSRGIVGAARPGASLVESFGNAWANRSVPFAETIGVARIGRTTELRFRWEVARFGAIRVRGDGHEIQACRRSDGRPASTLSAREPKTSRD